MRDSVGTQLGRCWLASLGHCCPEAMMRTVWGPCLVSPALLDRSKSPPRSPSSVCRSISKPIPYSPPCLRGAWMLPRSDLPGQAKFQCGQPPDPQGGIHEGHQHNCGHELGRVRWGRRQRRAWAVSSGRGLRLERRSLRVALPPSVQKPLAIRGRNTRCFQGFGHAITVCPKTIVYGHAVAVVIEAQAPQN